MDATDHSIIDDLENEWNRYGDVDLEEFLSRTLGCQSLQKIALTKYEVVVHSLLVDIERRMENGKEAGSDYDLDKYTFLAGSHLWSEVEAAIEKWKALSESPSQAQSRVPIRSTMDHDEQVLDPCELSGKQLGPYFIQTLIASGGMGVVYRAVDQRLDRLVALKVLKGASHSQSEQLLRFENEAKAVARLDHSSIVPVYETGFSQGLYFIAMAFIDGVDLATYVLEKPLSYREIAEICRRIAGAMVHSHAMGVIHRDLKPSNVLMDSSGVPRVTDFGLAKQINSINELTLTGQILGTPSFTSPEQAAGKKMWIGTASDVWGIGGILYFCLTKRPPFSAESPLLALGKVIHEMPVSPRALVSAVPIDLDTLCMRCLEKHPSDRIASATELVDDLGRYLRGEILKCRPSSNTKRLLRLLQRNKTITFVLALLALLIVAMTIALNQWSKVVRQESISRLNSKISMHLDIPPAANVDNRELHDLVEKLATESKAASADASASVINFYVDRINRALEKPRLSDSDFEYIANHLVLLRTWDVDKYAQCSEEVNERKKQWRIEFDGAISNEDFDKFFIPAAALYTDGKCFPISNSSVEFEKAAGDWLSPLVITRTVLDESFEIVATFEGPWKTVNSIGLAVPTNNDRGYEFLLRASTIGDANHLVSLQEARSIGQQCLCVILRSGQVVAQQTIDVDSLPNEQIEIRASCSEGQLMLQVNAEKELLFVDPIPISNTERRLGFRFPNPIGLARMQIAKRRIDVYDAFEEANFEYGEKDFTTAAAKFGLIASKSNSSLIKHEALFRVADCLLQIERRTDAIDALQALSFEEDSWAAMAAMQLWLLNLEDGKLDEADELAEIIFTKFSDKELKGKVPFHLWTEIVEKYIDFSRQTVSLGMDAQKRCRLLKNIYGINSHLFSNEGLAPVIAVELAIAYRWLDLYDEAIAVIGDNLQYTSNTDAWLRLQIQLNQCYRAKNLTSEALDAIRLASRDAPISRGTTVSLVNAECCSLAALGRWEEANTLCLESIDKCREPNQVHQLCDARLMLGFILLHQGDRDAAFRSWQKGWESGQLFITGTESLRSRALMNTIIMGALVGEFSAQELNQLGTRGQVSRVAAMKIALGLNQPNSIASAICNAWRSERGMQLAEDIAFDRIPIRDRIVMPLSLMSAFVLAEGCMDGPTNEEISTMFYEVLQVHLRQWTDGVQLGTTQWVQFGLAWQGTTGPFGLEGLVRNLDEESRKSVNLLFGMRNAFLKKDKVALDLFRNSAESPNERISKVANEGEMLLLKGNAELTFENLSSQIVEVQWIRVGTDHETNVLTLAPYGAIPVVNEGGSKQFLIVASGNYKVKAVDLSNQQLVDSEISLFDSVRRRIQISGDKYDFLKSAER